jgi:hypothetical protein
MIYAVQKNTIEDRIVIILKEGTYWSNPAKN